MLKTLDFAEYLRYGLKKVNHGVAGFKAKHM